MIYLFSGDDTKEKLASYDKFLAGLPEKAEKFFISRNNFDEGQIESLYSSAGLFSSELAIIFDNILEHEEPREFVLGKLDEMAESRNTFVFLEGKLGKPILDAFKKAYAELNLFELPKEKKEKYNNFLLANDLGAKDKLNLWIHFRQAVNLGVGLEELVGVLFWKGKDMILKRNFGKFKEDELKNFTSKISYLLPEARREGHDAECAFEQFLLESF